MPDDGSPRMHPVNPRAGLPIGTRVLKPGVSGRSRARYGTVMPHQPEFSGGSFPVRFDDELWEVLDVTYVTVVSRAADTVTLRRRRSQRAS